VLEGAEARGVAERGVEVGGVVAGAQNEDAARLVAPDANRPRGEKPEEQGRALAHALECTGELIEIDRALAARRRMVAGGVELHARASWRELVARDAPEVRRVDEELALGDAHGQDVGHVVVRDRVPVAFPIHETIDAAQAVRDASGVVGMAREGNELALLLLGESLEACAPSPPSLINDGVEPRAELEAQVGHVAERPAVEKGALELPKTPLDAGFCIGIPTHGAGPELVVRREGEEARIVDGLGPLPAQGDKLLAVVRARVGAALEAVERADVSVEERVEVVALEDVEEFPGAVREDVGERLHGEALAGGELDRVRGPVALGHLGGPVAGRREARRGLVPGARRPHVLLHRGVAAIETLALEDLEHTLRGDVRVAGEQLADPAMVGVDLLGPRGVLRSRERGVFALALHLVRGEHRLDGVAADAHRPCDLTLSHPGRGERHDLVDEFLAGAPGGRHAARSCPVTAVSVRPRAARTGPSATSPSRTTSGLSTVRKMEGLGAHPDQLP